MLVVCDNSCVFVLWLFFFSYLRGMMLIAPKGWETALVKGTVLYCRYCRRWQSSVWTYLFFLKSTFVFSVMVNSCHRNRFTITQWFYLWKVTTGLTQQTLKKETQIKQGLYGVPAQGENNKQGRGVTGHVTGRDAGKWSLCRPFCGWCCNIKPWNKHVTLRQTVKSHVLHVKRKSNKIQAENIKQNIKQNAEIKLTSRFTLLTLW